MNTVWLASDEDREGEAIAWHLSNTLGLKADNTKRIVFNEITKTAILDAIENLLTSPEGSRDGLLGKTHTLLSTGGK